MHTILNSSAVTNVPVPNLEASLNTQYFTDVAIMLFVTEMTFSYCSSFQVENMVCLFF